MSVGKEIVTLELLERIVLHSSLHFLRFRLPEGERLSFHGGQHMAFLVRDPEGVIHEKPMSIGSSPHQHELEFLVTIKEGSLGSTFFQSLKLGERVQAIGPGGSYGLSPVGRSSYFVSSHSGLAPMRSMLHELLERQAVPFPVQLFFSGPMEEANALTQEFERLRATHPSFDFRYYQTEDGESGVMRMQEALESIPSQEVDLYYCGGQAFMTEMRDFTENKGLPADSVHTERY